MTSNLDTTSILDLPTDPAGGGGSNVSLVAMEQGQGQGQGQGQNMSLDQTTINQIVNGLQKASMNGATQLPSRDIPIMTNVHTQDEEVQPNYIPTPKTKNDYIEEEYDSEEVIDNYNKNVQMSSSLDKTYTELQTPLLLSLLFFLFQLPIIKKFLFVYVPGIFFKDGNYNLYGYFFTSFLFGFAYYFLNRLMNIV